jgi:hypothetical protein
VISVTPRPRFTPGERTPDTHWIEGWVGPRAGLDAEARRKILCPCRGSNPDRPARTPTLFCLSYRASCYCRKHNIKIHSIKHRFYSRHLACSLDRFLSFAISLVQRKLLTTELTCKMVRHSLIHIAMYNQCKSTDCPISSSRSICKQNSLSYFRLRITLVLRFHNVCISCWSYAEACDGLAYVAVYDSR